MKELGALLPGWRVTSLADRLTLTPPSGRDAGAIRIREHVTPLVPLRRILDEELERAGRALAGVHLVDARRFVTAEGEQAALFAVRGHDEGRIVERRVGVIFGDRSYQRYDALLLDAAQASVLGGALEELMQRATLGLGEKRWRRFGYTPPAGWRGRARGLSAEWMPPGFPDDDTVLVVPPARSANDPSVFEQVLLHVPAGYRTAQYTGPLPVTSDHGLQGTAWRAEAEGPEWAKLHYEIVEMFDERYAYRVQLSTTPERLERDRALIAQVARSIRPIAARAFHSEADVFHHWAA